MDLVVPEGMGVKPWSVTFRDMVRKRVVVLSGAGVSAESGLRTFRDSDGLWEQYRIEDVATPEAFARDPALVFHFYDQRRAQVLAATPNAAHHTIAGLEQEFDVHVITQNIDDLHERAGSTRVLHLHGEITKARSTADPDVIVSVNGPSLGPGDRCPLGSQLRPHLVWFGEPVPLLSAAAALIGQAHILIIVGTSLQVYPAAGLVHALPPKAELHLVDPVMPDLPARTYNHIKEKASIGLPMLASSLRNAFISGR